MTIEQAQDRLNTLQEALPPLQEQATAARDALQAAEANRTPEGLEALIEAQQRARAAGEMLRQQQADISAAQAEITRLEAAQRQAALEAEHARNVQAYQDLMTKWEAAAKKFGKSLQDQLHAIADLEVGISEAFRAMNESAHRAGAEVMERHPSLSIRNAAQEHVKTGASGTWTIEAGVYRLSGSYARPGFMPYYPRYRRES